MKDKKTTRTRKVLLIAVASVLVAAVSVSATLAYLTAQTGSETNTFRGSGGITGNVLEPVYDTQTSKKYTIDQPFPKDPLVQNNTDDAAIYAGVRVSYWIQADPDVTTYTQVTPTVFSQYVTINDLATGSSGTWEDMTPGSEDWVTTGANQDSDADKACNYYMYKSVLTKSDTTAAYDSTEKTYTGNDSSQPLFKSVTVKPEVIIRSDGNFTGSEIPATIGTNTFKCFNFKIITTGYGVKAYAVKSGTNNDVDGDTLCTYAEAKGQILSELKKMEDDNDPA